uniref:Uncharacterized protein n=1 Tax=Arundo donax TaxID=35708 RepID=A0A0A9BWB0_ARUDO
MGVSCSCRSWCCF